MTTPYWFGISQVIILLVTNSSIEDDFYVTSLLMNMTVSEIMLRSNRECWNIFQTTTVLLMHSFIQHPKLYIKYIHVWLVCIIFKSRFIQQAGEFWFIAALSRGKPTHLTHVKKNICPSQEGHMNALLSLSSCWPTNKFYGGITTFHWAIPW